MDEFIDHERRCPGAIFDTDMATDCDDAGALAVLHTLERQDEVRILATVANNRGRYSVGAVAAINSFYDRSEIPIGAYMGDDVGTETAELFVDIATDTDTYGHSTVTRNQAPNSVATYRKTLAEARSNEVVIISVGHLNNLFELLRSEPDQYSELTGTELVERSVAKLVVMGGRYPSGSEHNFSARGSAQITESVLDQWPTPILFSGYELGKNVQTGPELRTLEESHPVRRAYAGHPTEPLYNGRPSWDQTAVLAAVRDPKRYWTLSEPGRVSIESDGSNSWIDEPDGPHRYLIESRDSRSSEVEEVVGTLMTDLPES